MKGCHDDDNETRFLPGDTVRIGGLKSAAQHNGKLAKVRRWIPERGRWALQLPEGINEVAVRARNLELVERLRPTATSSARQGPHIPERDAALAEERRQQLAAKKADHDMQLLVAADDGSFDEVVRLVEHGVSVDATDEDGWTAAMFAVGGGHVEVLGELIRRGANIEARNKDGETALHLATIKMHLECARALLAAGVRGSDA